MRFVTKAVRASAARRLLAGASFAALALGATPALAQDADDASANGTTAPPQAEQGIVVTGTRITVPAGMESPVPVTEVQAEQLEAMDPSSLINSLGQLPQFFGNTTPNNSNFFTRGGTGNLNLRGLGPNRTLTLLNGRRMPASSAFGGVDINVFPKAMIKSIETVTGGASAAYGTDAVAGVVNFILDTDYTGIEADVTVIRFTTTPCALTSSMVFPIQSVPKDNCTVARTGLGKAWKPWSATGATGRGSRFQGWPMARLSRIVRRYPLPVNWLRMRSRCPRVKRFMQASLVRSMKFMYMSPVALLLQEERKPEGQPAVKLPCCGVSATPSSSPSTSEPPRTVSAVAYSTFTCTPRFQMPLLS